MINNDIFKRISLYWSDQLNNEIYLKNFPGIIRGTREYFDIIISARKKYLYYFDKISSFFVSESKNKKLLEVGCGMGTDLLAFAKAGYSVSGIDLSDEHVKLARTCFNIYGHTGQINGGNAEALEFENDYFDNVFSLGVLHHTPDPQVAINEIYRVLKPGGRCFLMLYNKYSLNNLVHIVLRHPFENPKCSNAVANDSPVTYRFSKSAVRRMCSRFSSISIQAEYLFGAGWGKSFDVMPKILYRLLSKLVGWHLLVFLEK